MKRIILALLSILLLASLAISADITLKFAWDPNTESDMKEYRLYRTDGVRSKIGTYQHPTTITGPVIITVPNGSQGILSFVVTAVDTANNESGDSNTVTYPFDFSPPAQPGGFRIIQ